MSALLLLLIWLLALLSSSLFQVKPENFIHADSSHFSTSQNDLESTRFEENAMNLHLPHYFVVMTFRWVMSSQVLRGCCFTSFLKRLMLKDVVDTQVFGYIHIPKLYHYTKSVLCTLKFTSVSPSSVLSMIDSWRRMKINHCEDDSCWK